MPISQNTKQYLQGGTVNIDYMKNFTLLKSYLPTPSVYPHDLDWEENEASVESVLGELVTNRRFIHEAKEARRMIHQNPASFVDFTTKFSDLID